MDFRVAQIATGTSGCSADGGIAKSPSKLAIDSRAPGVGASIFELSGAEAKQEGVRNLLAKFGNGGVPYLCIATKAVLRGDLPV